MNILGVSLPEKIMYKYFNLLLFFLIIFFYKIYIFYSSNKNINTKNYNRENIEQVLKDKVSDILILSNDTNNVIEFNDSIDSQFKDRKKFFRFIK